ncbi:MAG: ribosome maturation factor RimP [Halanaerobiales bacterium]|nr:ribosome maturation factor RimP [Halanaerobiales bacterium]
MSKMINQLKKIIKPIVKLNDLDLVDIEYIKEGQNWILRIFVENEQSELTIDQLSNLSRLISQKLDEVDPIEKKYFLEVSSPGLERPLKKIKDYERFSGESIKISTYRKINGTKVFIGKLVGIDKNQVVTINLKDTDKKMEIDYSDIARANLYEEFNF